MAVREPTNEGPAALAEGRWTDARTAFEQSLLDRESAEAWFGLATALWWLGENRASVECCNRAYALFRSAGDDPPAARCAVWMAITYKANYANFAAANGWLRRADRLLEHAAPGPMHGWVAVARAYRLPDADAAERLTERALDIARSTGDVDLELVSLSQLGLVRVGRGDVEAGFALIDEAMAAALAGERSSLDTVAYACCDMINACELANDMERAAQWCAVADDFVARYGCPFLYAECRISYGTLLTARGRWDDAERELGVGVRITEGACPGLHDRAVVRLADLRVRQGRVEEAEQLLSAVGPGNAAEFWLLTAALALARGDAVRAGRLLEEWLDRSDDHLWHFASALDLLVDAHVAAGRADAARVVAERLHAAAEAANSHHLVAVAQAAVGRGLLAVGDDRSVGRLETALETWTSMQFPLEAARSRHQLAHALASRAPEAAVDHARRALRVFEELGATIDADRTAALLRSLGAVPRTGPKRAGALTVREREVLGLLGAGLTNPEIANRLHVSRKTASHHVSNILTKLGLRNRAEAAAYAVRLFDDPAEPRPGRS